jgi:cobalt-zinc-cadmium efflux system outer membrane protein
VKRLVIAILLASTTAAAQPAADVTVDQAIALYREHSEQLAAARAAVDVARADVVEAGIYPNPTLGVSALRTVAGTDTIGGTQPTASLDVPILIGHQRARRETAANAHVDAARAELAVAQGEAELEIRARFAALLAAQERTAVIDAAVADVRALREIVAGRSAAGASSPYALERIDLAIAALASRAGEARADERDAAGELGIAVGVPGWTPHASGALAPETASTSPGAAPNPGEHPALAADRADRAAALADEARAKADGVPTPSLGVQTFATTDPGGLVVGAGISIPLPLFDRNQGAVARARAEARRAEAVLAARTVELGARRDRAVAVLGQRRDALTRFQADALQRLAKLRTMAESAYKSGQGGIVELLDAVDAITDAKLRELELRQAVIDGELDLRRATLGR